jgi:hypothetical protein
MIPHAQISRGVLFTGLLSSVLILASSERASAQLISSGYPVKNRNFQMLVTDYGYADLALDERCGFEGREYLSGEWAAAVYYSGGSNPSGPRWLQPQWYYPDWVSNSDFAIQKAFGLANPTVPTNMYGYKVYSSTITNRDLRITMTYDTVRFGKDESDRLVLGLSAKSAGGIGTSLSAGRYVFRQKYEFQNITGGTLNNLKFYQLLHALTGGWGVYDDRDYGGGMSNYRYRLVQQGKSYSFDTRTMETVEHTDTIGVNFNVMPSGYELGLYGIKGVDSHEIGKPSAGVHLSVENDSFNSMDYFNPGSTGWVSGALRFDLGSLAPMATTSITALFGIHTTYEVKHPPINLVVKPPQRAGDYMNIDFQETTGNPYIGFLLRQASEVNAQPLSQWEPQPLPYYLDVPAIGWKRFQVPYSAANTKLFFWIEPRIIAEPEPED